MTVYRSPYAPRKQFLDYHYRNQRWSIIVAHRRAGKTIATINDLIMRMIKLAQSGIVQPRLGYVAPYRNQAKAIAWEYLKRYTAFLPDVEFNESELMVKYAGAHIRLYGADNADALRGGYFDYVVLDEFADFAPSVFPEIIRPQLADRLGGATFIGTPKGHNAFYELWRDTRDDDTWFRLMLKASETGIVSDAELSDTRKLMTEDQYQQEFEVSFEAAIQGAVYGKWMREADEAGRITNRVQYDPTYPVYTSWDLGFDDATAIWFYQVGMNELMLIDYYENSGEGVGHYCDVIKGKEYKYHTHFVPHDAANKLMAAGGRSIVEQAIKEHGIKMSVVPATSSQNSIEALRMTLPKCWFNADTCKHGIEALKSYCFEYNEESKVFKSKPKHDWSSHASDALELMARMWRGSITQATMKDNAIRNEFFKKRREHKMDNVDPYRIKPL